MIRAARSTDWIVARRRLACSASVHSALSNPLQYCRLAPPMVGIVVVSHSSELAKGLAELAGQMAGPDVRVEPAGGSPNGTLGTDPDLVNDAIKRADRATAW